MSDVLADHVESADVLVLAISPGVVWSNPRGPTRCLTDERQGLGNANVYECESVASACGRNCGARLVPWIETFLTLYTREAWTCYHSMFNHDILQNATNAQGYGYDRCFAAQCDGKQGVLVGHAVWHFRDNLYVTYGTTHSNFRVLPNSSTFRRVGRRLSLSRGASWAVTEAQGRQVVQWVQNRSSGRQCASRAPCARSRCPVEVLSPTGGGATLQQEDELFWRAASVLVARNDAARGTSAPPSLLGRLRNFTALLATQLIVRGTSTAALEAVPRSSDARQTRVNAISPELWMNATIWVQTRAHWPSGGPECLVQLACALHEHGHRVVIYPTRIAPRYASEYPCITKLPQRAVHRHAIHDVDVYIGPADHPCPSDAFANAWIWQLDTRSAARYRGPCRPFAHNQYLAELYRVPVVPPYITPTTLRECAANAHAGTPRELILIDDDTPPPIVARLRSAFPASATVVSGFTQKQVHNLTLRARYVVDWRLVGSERMPLEAVMCGATLLTANVSGNCALGRDFALPRASIVDNVDELIEALRRPLPAAAAMGALRASFSEGFSAQMLSDRMYADVVASGILGLGPAAPGGTFSPHVSRFRSGTLEPRLVG